MIFSKKLIDDTKEYFFSKSGFKLSDSEARQYLESLGQLGLVAIDVLSPGRGSTPRGRRGDCGAQAGGRAGANQASGGTELVAQSRQSAIDDSGDK